MRTYKHITVFENTYREAFLIEFGALIRDYMNSQQKDIFTYEFKDTPKSKTIRRNINNLLIEARGYVVAAGLSPYANIKYSPVGMTGPVDFLANIFSFQRVSFNRDHFEEVIDLLDRAVGIYRNDKRKALVRTFNPFGE
jgi:hypothetical protein